MSVAVVTVGFRSADALGPFLDSLAAASTLPLDAIVVDNAPGTDATAEVVAAHPGTRLLERPDNPGYGRAINHAVAALDPAVEWVVIANPDLVVSPGAVDTLLAVARERPRGAAFGPLIRSGDGSVYPSARELPSLRTGLGHALFVRVWPGNPWTARYRHDEEADRERVAGWLSGAFLLVRRSVFDELGGFDERYFMYFEDVDLGRRIGLAGWENRYVPSAEVVHLGGESTRTAARSMLIEHHRSAYRYLASRYRGWYLWPLRVALRVGLGLRSRLARG